MTVLHVTHRWDLECALSSRRTYPSVFRRLFRVGTELHGPCVESGCEGMPIPNTLSSFQRLSDCGECSPEEWIDFRYSMENESLVRSWTLQNTLSRRG